MNADCGLRIAERWVYSSSPSFCCPAVLLSCCLSAIRGPRFAILLLVAATTLHAQEVRRAQPVETPDASGVIRFAPTRGDPAAEKLAFADGLFAKREFDLAIAEYNNFLKEFPEASGRDAALLRLAESYRQKGDTANAQKTYERLVKEFNSGEFSCGRNTK